MSVLLYDMLRNDHIIFACEVLCLRDMECCQIDKDKNTSGIEGEDYTRFLDIRNSNRVKTEAYGLAGTEEATENTLGLH